MPDQILVSGLRVLGTHGVLAEEAARAQPFQLDLAVDVDLGPAVISDALDDALDYAWVAGVAAAIVAERHFSLLEALAEA
ncbi:MAG: dihydroneopterin aldolase, partial [Acidimicrobiales bacterium]